MRRENSFTYTTRYGAAEWYVSSVFQSCDTCVWPDAFDVTIRHEGVVLSTRLSITDYQHLRRLLDSLQPPAL